MKRNHSQRQRLRAAFGMLKDAPAKDPDHRISFGGKRFFPTSEPAALMAIHKFVGYRLPKRIAKQFARQTRFLLNTGAKEVKAPGCFKMKPVLGRIWVKVGGSASGDMETHERRVVPVCLHRGQHVNVRHQPDYIAPKKVRTA